ncbi:fumarate hydratase [Aliikangiella coralliicola]|uniref:Fumarate hydratase class I n=1 Tax=Aliikangiella coralliicola TaxID=2592383 RepID=A0A545U4S6_9GAMM|nr:fumarate hydratase [Aliikangiella coralliicola]TQV84468.1 fumarate hydratase [Aliikangiella coralliicola]
MTVINKTDFIDSVESALQYISYYHPKDFIDSLYSAYQKEQNPAARDAMAQMLINSRMCAEGKRPICQDTGIVTVFVKIGMGVQWDSDLTVQQMVDEGVRRAYLSEDNPLRASIVANPVGPRKNTKDNTPAVVHVKMVSGNTVDVTVAAKGGGSENKSKFVMLNPNDSIVDWVLKTVPTMGAGWCPPGMLGLGIGGTAEKAMVLAKESLMDPIDIHELIERGAETPVEKLRLELYEKVNQLGIGAQGLGGLTTVLDIKINDCPTHAASLPIAMIPNCAATRHAHFVLDGNGPSFVEAPSLEDWPVITQEASDSVKKVNLDNITQQEIESWQPGDTLLLSGKILTGRDAAHKKIKDILDQGESLPEGVDFEGRFIYYVGPVDPVGDEVVGPAGPTTSTRMDKYSDMMLNDKSEGGLGLMGMIGKAERGDAALASIKKNKSVYLMAVGGAAFLVSKAIKQSRVVAFEELGMEAIYEFEVQDMPVTVAVDTNGDSVHKTGPQIWKVKIQEAG